MYIDCTKINTAQGDFFIHTIRIYAYYQKSIYWLFETLNFMGTIFMNILAGSFAQSSPFP